MEYAKNAKPSRRLSMTIISGDIHQSGSVFTVICTRCKYKFKVIRNWGGGLRLFSDERVNPAKCPQCGSIVFEVY